MKTPISKEQLREYTDKKVNSLRFAIKQSAFTGITEGIEKELQLAEFALAAMDAEPVYQCEFCHHDANGELQWHWEDVNQAFYEQYDSERRGHRRVLYAAPPVPVLQEDIPDSVYEILCQACGGKAWMYEAALWDACRDEILKNSASVNPSTDAGCGTNNPSNCASVKDHQIRELVNQLRDVAVEYHGTKQLRDRIARVVRTAMLQGVK